MNRPENGDPADAYSPDLDTSELLDGEEIEIDIKELQRLYGEWIKTLTIQHWHTNREDLIFVGIPIINKTKRSILFTLRDQTTRNEFKITGIVNEYGGIHQWIPGR